MNNKIIVKDTLGNVLQIAFFDSIEKQEAFLNVLSTNHPWGKPERIVPKLDEFGFAVIKDNGEVDSEVLPAEYQVEIVDVSIDANYILEKVQQARRSEYPSEAEVIEALMEEKDGKPEKLAEITAKRLAVKAKYPKNVLPQKD